MLENVIAISVENELKPTRVPSGNMVTALGAFGTVPRTTFDFFPFAGIHRPVVLYTVPPNVYRRCHRRDRASTAHDWHG